MPAVKQAKKSLKKPARTRRRFSWVGGWILKLVYRCLLIFVLASLGFVLIFRWLPPPTSSVMIQRYFQNHEVQQDAESAIRYRWVAYENVSPYMALAVVAGEDQKFAFHGGFDFAAIKQALEDRLAGKTLRGASTISQQVAKNLYLWPGRSLLRKGLEAWFTMLLEMLWPKQRILEVYLNIVELGEQVFGVEAASQRFFYKSASQLNREEAALLAAVLPNPRYYRVDSPSSYVRQRQAWILQQMRQLGGVHYLRSL
jgi:monofunctional biosynthetic peptidoglycan transglycosylase